MRVQRKRHLKILRRRLKRLKLEIEYSLHKAIIRDCAIRDISKLLSLLSL